MLQRLDAELVRRKLARSRTQAAELIDAGRVSVGGIGVRKPASQVSGEVSIVVADPADGQVDYVSRGGHKLAGALDAMAARGAVPVIDGQVCLDAGASTGGFTDVLLRRGAGLVWAVDVGYGQLDWALQTDPRVRIRDRTNVRHLAAGDLDPAPSLVVADLSFISLATVLPALVAVTSQVAGYMLMVKPQFEVGRQRLGAGGVVRQVELRAAAVEAVVAAGVELGLSLWAVARSPLPGPSGNVEFFIYLRSGVPGGLSPQDSSAAIAREVAVDGGQLSGARVTR